MDCVGCAAAVLSLSYTAGQTRLLGCATSCNRPTAALPACIWLRHRWLSLPADTTTDDLMGTKGTKKGGLKSSRTRKIGPHLMVNSMHEDRRPVSVVVQVTNGQLQND
jgi:hypothetical protein